MNNILVFAPVVVLAVGFVAYCLNDLRTARVRWLPKWLWAIICVISIPVGGLIYLTIGRLDGPVWETSRNG